MLQLNSHPWNWEETVRWLREQPDQVSLVRDSYYDDPLEAAAHRYWQSSEWRAVAERLPKLETGRALDFGAGRGIASFALAKSGYRVVALEADSSALVGTSAIRSLASVTGLPIEVEESSSERLPCRDAEFDLVFGRAVMHHIRDIDGLCREFHRVLKPGGMLVVIREHVLSKEDDLKAFQSLHPLHKYYGGEHAFVLGRYTAAIRQAGFEIKEIINPLRSVINLYPHSLDVVALEVARRAGLGVPLLRRAVAAVIGIPAVWWLVLRAIEAVDHRPGRLYSFIASRT